MCIHYSDCKKRVMIAKIITYFFNLIFCLNAVVHGLAVETVSGKIYFTNNNKVEVVNSDGRERARVIEHSNGARTYGVAVDIADR